MDTSKISQLDTIEATIRPHLKKLPFMRLGEHLNEFERPFMGHNYHFRYYKVKGTLGQSIEDKVRPILVTEKFHLNSEGNVDKVDMIYMILERASCGGIHCDWLFHCATFEIEYTGTLKNLYYFQSTGSEIVWGNSVNDREEILNRLNLPADWYEKVLAGVIKWIKDSSKDRLKIVQELGELEEVLEKLALEENSPEKNPAQQTTWSAV